MRVTIPWAGLGDRDAVLVVTIEIFCSPDDENRAVDEVEPCFDGSLCSIT